MTTVGLEHDEISSTDWIIPPTLTSDQLQESLDLIKKYTDDPISFEDGKLSEDLIKRKQKARKAFDSDDDENDNQEEYLFEPGGPTAMESLEQKPKKPSKKRRIREDAENEELPDELAIERRKKRLDREREKRLAIKSDLYVHDSDDESDPEKEMEFLLREKMQRESGFIGEITGAPLLVVGTDFKQFPATKKRKKLEKEERIEKGKKKRKAVQESDEELVADDDDDDEDDEAIISREASPLILNAVDLASDDDESDGPYTIGPVKTSNEVKGAGPSEAPDNDVVMNDAEEDDEEDDAILRPGRGRRGPVVIDSDSE